VRPARIQVQQWRWNGQQILVRIVLAGLGSACFELFSGELISGMDEGTLPRIERFWRLLDAAGMNDMQVSERSRSDKKWTEKKGSAITGQMNYGRAF
jgi:hypothetical protein